MWARLKRLFRSIFGGLIESAEDPELILQQTIRDMREKVPQMQNNVVQVMATEKLLQKEVVTLEREIKEEKLQDNVRLTGHLRRDEVLQNMTAEQLEGLAQRAWRRARSSSLSSACTWPSALDVMPSPQGSRHSAGPQTRAPGSRQTARRPRRRCAQSTPRPHWLRRQARARH